MAEAVLDSLNSKPTSPNESPGYILATSLKKKKNYSKLINYKFNIWYYLTPYPNTLSLFYVVLIYRPIQPVNII